MERSANNALDSMEKSPTPEEIQTVRDAISSFVIALKNYALYPEKHVICQKSIANTKSRLNDFLKDHDRLRIDIKKDQLLFGKEVISLNLSEKENLNSFLFRDGILWLEFQKNITLEEIRKFIKILHKYKDFHEEAEGDLVTALWEVDFPNIKYKAVDIYWQNDSGLDLSLLNAGGPQSQDLDRQEKEPDISEETESADHQEEKRSLSVEIPLHSTGDGLWELTPEEGMELHQMIIEAETRDSTQDILDVLLIVINDQRTEEDLSSVLGFLEGEFKDTLAQGDFEFSLKILRNLHEIRQEHKNKDTWALPVFNHFFRTLSDNRVLGSLSQIWSTLDSIDVDRIKALREFLLLLPSNAILALGPMLPQIRSSNIQRQIMEVIGIMAKRDLRPLARLIDDCSEEFVVLRLVNILGQLEGETPDQILLKLTRHSSGRIRKAALKHLLEKDEQIIKELFHLIEDPDMSLRRVILDYLGSRRNTLSENLLLDYLITQMSQPANRQHLLACYRALGECGSSGSIPFLQKQLLNKCWIPGSIRSLHRQGAVIALQALKTDDAKEILKKASRSMFPTVRFAYRKAVEVGQ